MKRIVLSFALLSLLVLSIVSPSLAAKGKSKGAPQRIVVTVTSKGFEPATIPVVAGKPIVLVITRTTARTCATDIVIADRKIKVALPLNQAVEVKLAAEKPGTLRFACAMDMIAGEIVVK